MSYVKRQQLQTHLSQATAQLEEAKRIADELGEGFEFMGRRYEPKKVVTTGGHFDHEAPQTLTESWESSDEDWQSSSMEC